MATSPARGSVDRLPFSAGDVRRKFTAETLRRGQGYARDGRVRELELSAGGRLLRAKVHGTRPRPYAVTVSVRGPGPARIEASCTCPVGFACKHAAAAMLAALGEVPAAPPPSASDPLAGPVGQWLEALAASAAPAPASGPARERVLYILHRRDDGRRAEAEVEILLARPLKGGGYGAARRYEAHNLAQGAARFVTGEDALVGQLLLPPHGPAALPAALPRDPLRLDLAFRRMLATGRCHFAGKDTTPLTQGPGRHGRLGWALDPSGEQVPVAEAEEPGLVVLACAAPWYVDAAAGRAGPLAFDQPPRLVAAFLEAPPVPPEQGGAVRARLEARLGGHALPPPRAGIAVVRRREPPVPSLLLTTGRFAHLHLRQGFPEPAAVDLACLAFDYGGTVVAPDGGPKELRRAEGGRIVVHRRDARAERAARARLAALGFAPAGLPAPPARGGGPGGRLPLALAEGTEDGWRRLVHREVPALRAEGWRVEADPGFRHRVVEAAGEWEATLEERGTGWWFSLELGVEVEGERIPLLPILAEAIRRMRPGPGGEPIPREGALYAPLPDGRVLALPMDRVRPMLEALVELLDAGSPPGDGRLEVSPGQVAALAEIADATRLRWLGGDRLRALVGRLRDAAGVEEAPAPPGFRAELRPYQRRGLGWLRLLREHGLGGILADDMGLGKTVQTLAHLLAEKRAGRLDAPALVVCPTSLVANWEGEALRFAPDLRVLRLHGRDRAARFGRIAAVDLVLSTYTLLLRDAEVLLPLTWSLVVLDEAQAIKNPTAKATALACRLEARHRLCLTGTPVENHLGELWSQFAFLLPGLLGDRRRFGRLFRTPIEKRGDVDRRAALAARLRPFVLRRTKEQVAPELPARTEIVRRVALAGDQRDLYETVRLAMHERVRREIAAKGFERSRIVVLDALLKLRQVCCDPRLVRLAAARRVSSSGKLALLLEMLPELVGGGRRVLLFSQFTSMLDLVRPELEGAGIPFVELRGGTRDRGMPVARFQRGEVPLFLASLKAGGVGLNLTAADTVILYDPWWNPAVERQAADRAHRIGQDKPVFVYKLIAEGTIEERMLELQERKRALASGLLDDEGESFAGFAPADLELLLAPLG